MSSSYLQKAGSFEPQTILNAAESVNLHEVVKQHKHKLTLVGRGISGALALPLLAHYYECELAVVRKNIEDAHGYQWVEGIVQSNWLFVDDFYGTGETFIQTHKKMQHEHGGRTQWVGAFYYAHHHGAYLQFPDSRGEMGYLAERYLDDLQV